jgi:hypothetical protein
MPQAVETDDRQMIFSSRRLNTPRPFARSGRGGEKGVTCRLAQKMQAAHAFLWEYSDKTLKLAQFLGRLGVFLTTCGGIRPPVRRPSSSDRYRY